MNEMQVFAMVLLYTLEVLVVGAVAYLFGSLPCGLTICKWFKGKEFDIRDYGSSNVGFTNVKAVLGFRIGLIVMVADILKSFFPIFAAGRLGMPDGVLIAGVLAGGFGHGYSVFMYIEEGKFSGGKSVATFFGGFLGAQPLIAAIAFGVWFLVLLASKYMFLSSIMGGLATVVAAIFLHKGPLWISTCAIVTLYLIIKHLPNISRWLHGTETKFNQKRGKTSGEEIVAFAVHPRDEKDLVQSPVMKLLEGRFMLENGRFSLENLRALAKLGVTFEAAEITGIECLGGERVRVLIYAIPFLPDQIRDENNWVLITQWLETAAIDAQRRGATDFGLGGLLSTVNKDGGAKIQSLLAKLGYKINVDNGSENTSAATIEAAKKVAGDRLSRMTVADVGARGYIGRGTGEGLTGLVSNILPVLRNKNAASEDPIQFGTLATTDDLANLENADMVILCTSSPTVIIGPDEVGHIKKGAIVLDVAFPPDFEERLVTETMGPGGEKIPPLRPDITLIRCGLVLPPGDPKCQIDFHFGHVTVDNVERFLIPACLAQVIIRGITGKKIEHLNRPPTRENVTYFSETAKRLGFKVIVSKHSEQQIYSGEVEAPS